MSFKLYLLFIVMTFLRPIELLAPELAVYRPMLVLSLLLFVSSVASAMSTKKMAATKQHFSLLIWFVIVVGISVMMNEGFGRGVAAMADFGPTPMLFVTSVMNLTSMERLRKAGTVVVICMCAQVGVSLTSYYTGWMANILVYKEGLPVQVERKADGVISDIPAFDESGGFLWRLRSIGILNDPNDFAQVLVATLPLLLVLHRKRAAVRNALLVWAPALSIVYAVYLTHSRGALLGLGSLFFFSVKRILGTVKTALFVGGAVVGAMGVGFTGGRSYSADDESAGGRIDAWSEGLVMLRTHPIWGVGHGRFAEHHTHTAHNSFVLCFAEMGLWGYFLWLGMIVLIFKQLNMAIAHTSLDDEERRWAFALRTSLVGFFTCGMFLSRAYQPPLYILLALSIGAWHSARLKVQGTPTAALFAAPVKWKGTTAWLEVFTIFVFWVVVTVKTAMVGKSI